MQHQLQREHTSVEHARWRIQVLQSLIESHRAFPSRGEEWHVTLAEYLERQTAAREELGRLLAAAA